MVRLMAAAAAALLLLGAASLPARADFKMCNNTESRVGVALGYKDKVGSASDGWASEGWWTIKSQQCLPLLKGNLIARYYYVYAVDYDKGGSWGGNSLFCTRDKVFTIRGIDNCIERGYQKTGFFEVDTGEESDWTVSLAGEKTTQGK